MMKREGREMFRGISEELDTFRPKVRLLLLEFLVIFGVLAVKLSKKGIRSKLD